MNAFEQEVHEHDAEPDRRARGAVPAADEPGHEDDDRRDDQAVLDDVERDVALYRWLRVQGFPSSSRLISAWYQ